MQLIVFDFFFSICLFEHMISFLLMLGLLSVISPHKGNEVSHITSRDMATNPALLMRIIEHYIVWSDCSTRVPSTGNIHWFYCAYFQHAKSALKARLGYQTRKFCTILKNRLHKSLSSITGLCTLTSQTASSSQYCHMSHH